MNKKIFVVFIVMGVLLTLGHAKIAAIKIPLWCLDHDTTRYSVSGCAWVHGTGIKGLRIER
jgi:hypothetical protein